jgi:thiol reductant ABC exporter CydC subunit
MRGTTLRHPATWFRAGAQGTPWRLLKLLAPFSHWMALSVLLGVATVASGVALLATSAYIIAKAALRPSIAELQVVIVGVRFFGITRGLFRYLERLVSHQVTFRLLARLRVWFYQALEPLAPARLMQYRGGDLLARVVADVETLESFYLRVVAPPLVALLAALLTAALMAAFDLRLAATLLAFLALAGLGVPLLARALGRGLGTRLVRARSELNVALVDGIQGMPDLLAFGQEGRHQERVGGLGRALVGLQGRMAWISGLQSALSGLLTHLATLAVLLIAVPLVREGRLEGVYLAVLVLAAIASFEAVLPLPAAFQGLESNVAAARRLFEIVDAEPPVQDPPGPSPTPNDYSLAIENLRFRYDAGEPLALDGVSLALPQGGRLAVVGPSGAGKTTLVNLLLRFWEYQEGHILLGGHELRQYPQDVVRRMVSVVSQHTHLFNGTVRENLLIARPDASEAELTRAARQAQMHEFVTALPQGYDTWIGEAGLRLSGGERQRLAIARALLKDAPILILDEATANLDALVEREIMGTVYALTEGRTTLIITHRLVGLEAVDEILVLQAGRVVERGQHHDLLQMQGLYWRMWELQKNIDRITNTWGRPTGWPQPISPA